MSHNMHFNNTATFLTMLLGLYFVNDFYHSQLFLIYFFIGRQAVPMLLLLVVLKVMERLLGRLVEEDFQTHTHNHSTKRTLLRIT